ALASRASTVHFAHAGVSTVAALIFSGASAKLFWDARNSLQFGLGVMAAALAFGLLSYAAFRYTRGRRLMREELDRYALFQALRRRLGLDDPSVLLPR